MIDRRAREGSCFGSMDTLLHACRPSCSIESLVATWSSRHSHKLHRSRSDLPRRLIAGKLRAMRMAADSLSSEGWP